MDGLRTDGLVKVVGTVLVVSACLSFLHVGVVLFLCFVCTIVASFGIHREHEDSNSDQVC